ncbi:hypothetical protein BPSY_2213 [Bifidobacterium psychraerophilum]|uniref:Uncharacterized protein n=1 Tax=Bifidobacterium psychraerophilum TaxID=218140 RepID=A0A087CIZ8_9BIFI|nr:hypothetical protein BPSY_2213 [Bifidobacterium psychraerophilum]
MPSSSSRASSSTKNDTKTSTNTKQRWQRDWRYAGLAATALCVPPYESQSAFHHRLLLMQVRPEHVVTDELREIKQMRVLNSMFSAPFGGADWARVELCVVRDHLLMVTVFRAA